MTAAARELLFPATAPARALAPSRALKPRRRAYRRGEFGRPKFVELDPQIAPAGREAKFWERYAIPCGIGAFWIVFVASNWDSLGKVFGLT
ncbi:MAG TPA: hypothetical protein VFB36_17025 [Nevskiaceae bacterium]|nr:hypothetical protein [Nevskiaceae bacterium]